VVARGDADGVAFDGDDELGEVAVADDPPELLLATSIPAAVQCLRCRRRASASRCVACTVAYLDTSGLTRDSSPA